MYDNEQEHLKKIYNIRIAASNFFINAVLLLNCVVSLASAIQYLIMDSRTPHDNEQLMLNMVMFFACLFVSGLNNFWGNKIFRKFMGFVNGKKEKTNSRKRGQISNLDSALNKLSQQHGIIVWDTIWGSFVIFMIAIAIAFHRTCNLPVVAGITVFLLIMLLGGHIIGIKINKSRHFEKRLCKYSGEYVNYSNEESYISAIDRSIQRGVAGFTGYWLLTDEYMIGRLSDLTYEPVAVPLAEIEKCTFFYNKNISARGLPIGVLQLRLYNRNTVNFVLGRGNVCDQTLQVLNEAEIPWSQAEMRYI